MNERADFDVARNDNNVSAVALLFSLFCFLYWNEVFVDSTLFLFFPRYRLPFFWQTKFSLASAQKK